MIKEKSLFVIPDEAMWWWFGYVMAFQMLLLTVGETAGVHLNEFNEINCCWIGMMAMGAGKMAGKAFGFVKTKGKQALMAIWTEKQWTPW
ncbi:hypothetical protein [Spiroplasma poulsonii]|uniref:hypothetical protein n=1 Tax=Spiroplasma poulsonii TaxID=2138 RepID=UPI001F4CEE92|nr:hypothetical protein [Spiroplasma poulsonii]UNF62251.1 hypothetical protein MNU24_01980 [Spiroplasma poulsonii]